MSDHKSISHVGLDIDTRHFTLADWRDFALQQQERALEAEEDGRAQRAEKIFFMGYARELETAFVFPFTKLPGEIRNEIYGYVVGQDVIVSLMYDLFAKRLTGRTADHRGSSTWKASAPGALTLLLANKQIYYEALGFLYGKNTFFVAHSWTLNALFNSHGGHFVRRIIVAIKGPLFFQSARVTLLQYGPGLQSITFALSGSSLLPVMRCVRALIQRASGNKARRTVLQQMRFVTFDDRGFMCGHDKPHWYAACKKALNEDIDATMKAELEETFVAEGLLEA